MKASFETAGTCSSFIEFEVEGGIVKNVSFTDGCDGNAQGISRLVEGMSVSEVISRLKDIKCEDKETSCPDQLAKALCTYL